MRNNFKLAFKCGIFATLLGFLVIAGCGGGGEGGSSTPPTGVTKSLVSGSVQKGPFLNGTNITIYELDANLNQTGKNYTTQITSYNGSFKLSNISFASNYVELKADGYYYNEVSGSTSVAPITLYSLVDISDKNSVNINLLTHLERERVKTLMSTGATFANAKKQSQKEVLQLFGINRDAMAVSESLDLTQSGTDNAILLAVSAILQGNRTEAELLELLANISSDLKQTGTLLNSTSGSALLNAAKYLDMPRIAANLADRCSTLGIAASVPDGSAFVSNFVATTNFQLTEAISYPVTGENGPNLLNAATTSLSLNTTYSMAANLPKGHTLKVRISGDYDNWAYAPFSTIGWQWDNYDTSTHSRTFTATATGAIDSYIKILVDPMGRYGSLKVEIFEDGRLIPTQTKIFPLK